MVDAPPGRVPGTADRLVAPVAGERKTGVEMAAQVRTDVPGSVWKVLVAPGDAVKAGDTLFILEVMKTEVPHEAPIDGTVSAVHIAEGDEGIEEGTLAVEIG